MFQKGKLKKVKYILTRSALEFIITIPPSVGFFRKTVHSIDKNTYHDI